MLEGCIKNQRRHEVSSETAFAFLTAVLIETPRLQGVSLCLFTVKEVQAVGAQGPSGFCGFSRVRLKPRALFSLEHIVSKQIKTKQIAADQKHLNHFHLLPPQKNPKHTFKCKIKSEKPTFNSANTVCQLSVSCRSVVGQSVLLQSLRRRSFESSTSALLGRGRPKKKSQQQRQKNTTHQIHVSSAGIASVLDQRGRRGRRLVSRCLLLRERRETASV